MAKIEMTLSLDAALVARVISTGGVLTEVIETALRRHLEHAAEDETAARRWAEDNALALEALAGGAEEAKV